MPFLSIKFTFNDVNFKLYMNFTALFRRFFDIAQARRKGNI